MDINYKAFLSGFLLSSILFFFPKKPKQKSYFTTKQLQSIKSKKIIVFGVGGVGSHVVQALSQYTSNITIVDFDRVTLSSLNRHAIATRKSVGNAKTSVFSNILGFHETYVTPSNIQTFFQNQQYDMILDCIDNIDAKLSLIQYAISNQIPIITSCGAGMKADPTRIQFSKLSSTNYDDLARAIRHKLKKLKINYDLLPVVYSNEQTDKQLLPLKEHQEQKVDEYRPFSNYRLRIVPVIGTMPALFGQSIATFTLLKLANVQIDPNNITNNNQLIYARFNTMLIGLATKRGESIEDVNVDMYDIYLIAREVYDLSCLISMKKTPQIEMVIWNPEGKIEPVNLCLMYGQHAKKHKQLKKKEQLKEIYGEDILKRKEEMDKKLDKLMKQQNLILYK